MQEHVKSAFLVVITVSFRSTASHPGRKSLGKPECYFFVNMRGEKKKKKKRKVKTQTKSPSLPNLLDNAFCSQTASRAHFEDLICLKYLSL